MINVGIIGSGFGLYGLLPAFWSIPKARVISFCGKQSPRLLNIFKKLALENSVQLYQNWEEMLTCEPLDALVIAVPPSAQYPIAKSAIEKKIHIFAEKPLTVQLAHAYDLLDLATSRKITHGVDFLFREIDVWKMAKNMIDEKKFGDICHVAVNWDFRSYDVREKKSSWKTDASVGGGALSFYFSHVLDYLEYFCGTISNLKSHFSYSPDSLNGGEIGVDLDLQFTQGTTGTAHISCDSNFTQHQLFFTCQTGQIVLENRHSVTENFVLKATDKQGREMRVLSQDLTPDKGPDNDERVIIVKRLAEKFIDACLNSQQMIPSFVEGLRVQELIEQVKSSR